MRIKTKKQKKLPSRGLLVVLEGLDRSGKSTQAKLLVDELNKDNLHPTELWKYPNRGTSIGQVINNYLLKNIELEDHAVHLLFSANRWETIESMKQKLNAGVNLVLDRYAYSGVAYTAAKGFDLEWCKQCDMGLPKPDIIVFMDSHASKLCSRSGFGDERYETNQFQSRVYDNFCKLLVFDSKEQANSSLTASIAASSNSSGLLMPDSTEPIEIIHQVILDNVKSAIQSNKFKAGQFEYLW